MASRLRFRLGWFRAVIVTAAVLGTPLCTGAEPQPPISLSAAQRERLKERDALSQQARKLRAEGKTAEAVTAAQAMVAIERELFGKDSDEVIRSTKLVALWNEQSEDWPALKQARSDVLTALTARFGKDNDEAVEALGTPEGRDALTDERSRPAQAQGSNRDGAAGPRADGPGKGQ